MSKRSDRNKDQDSTTNEPWEQPIYDVESNEHYSRSAQHQQKRGSTVFLSVVLFLLFLCVLVPSVVGIFLFNQKKNAEQAVVQSSSEVIKTSESSKEKPKESESHTETSPSESVTEQSSSTTTSSSSSASVAEEAGSTIKVNAGEGPNQIAARAGISVQKLLELNGMTMSNFFFSPGQEVKIK